MTSPNPQEGGKHTPGEWRVEQSGLSELRNVSTYVVAGDRNDGVLVCEVNTDLSDAHLLAAAPALLEALHNMVSLARPHFTDETQRLAMDEALAALLQAAGGENGR